MNKRNCNVDFYSGRIIHLLYVQFVICHLLFPSSKQIITNVWCYTCYVFPRSFILEQFGTEAQISISGNERIEMKKKETMTTNERIEMKKETMTTVIKN